MHMYLLKTIHNEEIFFPATVPVRELLLSTISLNKITKNDFVFISGYCCITYWLQQFVLSTFKKVKSISVCFEHRKL